MNPKSKFLKSLDESLDQIYKSDKLYEFITQYHLGDNTKINPFNVALYLERLYSRIDELETKLEELKAL